MTQSLPTNDLEHVFVSGGQLWEALRGARLFVTGGTGFVGTWMLETLLWADARLELGVQATVLTRDPGASHVNQGISPVARWSR